MLATLQRPSLDTPIDEVADGKSPYLIRLMSEADLPTVIALDAKQTGREREAYYREKFAACIREPGINTSLVAETDGFPIGFLFGRLFFGEFGIPATRAVLDTFGVHPGFRGKGAARALLSQYGKNMEALRVEAIDTLVDWDRFDLLGFFEAMGFRPSRDVDLVWDIERYPFGGRASPVSVRAAEEADLPTITAIDREMLAKGRPTYFAAKWKAGRQRPQQTLFLLAELRGEPAGYLVASLYQGEFGIDVTRGVIDSFGVGERFQHRGVASGLLEHLLAWLKERGVTQMETLCRWNDWELLRFFEYAGFRPSARLNLEWRFT